MVRTHYRIHLAPDFTTTTEDRDLAERHACDGYRVTAFNEVSA